MFDYICETCGTEGRQWRRESPPRFCSRACKSIGMAGKSLKRIKHTITPEMHIRIEQTYKTMTGNGEVNALCSKLQLPRWKITRYAITQGWIAKQKKEPDWSERELRILSGSAHLSPERIQKNLRAAGFRRTTTGIVLKRKRMRFLQNLNGYSSRSVAECFGVDDHVVTRWIKLGFLRAKRRGTMRTPQQGGDIWYIKERWIRKFLIEYLPEIDFRKIDKYWVVDLLASGEHS